VIVIITINNNNNSNHHPAIRNVGIRTDMTSVVIVVVGAVFSVSHVIGFRLFCSIIVFHEIILVIIVIYLEHVIEADYHAPPVGDFGFGRGGMMESGGGGGYRDTFESWETAGAGGYSMNAMFVDGGLPTDYELSNINSVSMTPNGKYAIVGQSQGPPQIWDAVVKQ
jgi:hypothetical protein